MFETRNVTLTVSLPDELADLAEAVHAEDPAFFARAIVYALTRRMVFGRLQEARSPDEPPEPAHFPGLKDGQPHLMVEGRSS